MKTLTEEEFKDRLSAIQRSRRIFVETGLTNNITTAFEVYQSILAERDREIFMNTIVNGNRNPALMDKFERPKCPECNFDLMFRVVPPNDEGVVTQLVCNNPSCDVVLNSDKSLNEWMTILEIKQ
jgi:hypothetical protein